MHREKLRAIKYEDRMKVKSLFEPFEKTNAEFYDSMLKALGMSSSQQDAAETRAVDPGDGSHKASLERVFTAEHDRCVGCTWYYYYYSYYKLSMFFFLSYFTTPRIGSGRSLM